MKDNEGKEMKKKKKNKNKIVVIKLNEIERYDRAIDTSRRFY